MQALGLYFIKKFNNEMSKFAPTFMKKLVDENVVTKNFLIDWYDRKIKLDKKSNLYISETEIDWSYDLMDRGLKFNNPHAKGSCGCKTSFMMDLPQDTEKIPSWM